MFRDAIPLRFSRLFATFVVLPIITASPQVPGNLVCKT